MGVIKNIAILVWALKNGGAERIAGLLSVNLSRQYNVYLFVWDTSDIVYEYGGTLVDVSGKDMRSIEKNIREKKLELKIDCSISFLTGVNDLNIRLRVNDKIIISERCAQSPNIFFNACMNSGVWNNYCASRRPIFNITFELPTKLFKSLSKLSLAFSRIPCLST